MIEEVVIHKWASGSSSHVVLRVSEVELPTQVRLTLEGQHATSTPQYVGLFGASTLSRMGDFWHPHQSFTFLKTITISGLNAQRRLTGVSEFTLEPTVRYLRLDMNEFLETGGDVEKHMVSISLDKVAVSGTFQCQPSPPQQPSSPPARRETSSSQGAPSFSSPVSELRYRLQYDDKVAGWRHGELDGRSSAVVREATELLRLRGDISLKKDAIKAAAATAAHMESVLEAAVKQTQCHLAHRLREHTAAKLRYEWNAAALEAALRSN
jgi:hypothetical protein